MERYEFPAAGGNSAPAISDLAGTHTLTYPKKTLQTCQHTATDIPEA